MKVSSYGEGVFRFNWITPMLTSLFLSLSLSRLSLVDGWSCHQVGASASKFNARDKIRPRRHCRWVQPLLRLKIVGGGGGGRGEEGAGGAARMRREVYTRSLCPAEGGGSGARGKVDRSMARPSSSRRWWRWRLGRMTSRLQVGCRLFWSVRVVRRIEKPGECTAGARVSMSSRASALFYPSLSLSLFCRHTLDAAPFPASSLLLGEEALVSSFFHSFILRLAPCG